jgi:hypothetical protein
MQNTLVSFDIELSTRSTGVVSALMARVDAHVTTEKNITGETIVMLSLVFPLARAVIKEVGSLARDRQVSIRSQKLTTGPGTLKFEGFSADEICEIMSKLGAIIKE